jgi:hypothetical protein
MRLINSLAMSLPPGISPTLCRASADGCAFSIEAGSGKHSQVSFLHRSAMSPKSDSGKL